MFWTKKKNELCDCKKISDAKIVDIDIVSVADVFIEYLNSNDIEFKYSALYEAGKTKFTMKHCIGETYKEYDLYFSNCKNVFVSSCLSCRKYIGYNYSKKSNRLIRVKLNIDFEFMMDSKKSTIEKQFNDIESAKEIRRIACLK